MPERYTLNVNGKSCTVEAEADTPLLYILRNDLKLKGASGKDSTNMFGVANNQYNADQLSVAEPPRRPGNMPQLYFALGEGPAVEPMSRLFQPRGFANRFVAVANVPAGPHTIIAIAEGRK